MKEVNTVKTPNKRLKNRCWSTFDNMSGSNTKRIVLLGKTGAGKSSLVNNMFGEEVCTVGHNINAETKITQSKTGSVNGREITLIDTPGFFDTNRPEEEIKPEIVRCITECSPGPHAFLLMLKVEKYTEHEKAVISKICEYFSQEVFKYATVLFTHGDQLDKGQTIQDFVGQNDFMSDLVKKCGGRCHVIDNKYWNKPSKDDYRSNRFQVEQLLKTIDKTVEENQGRCYTNEMLQAVEENIRQEEQHIRERSGNMSEEEIREQAKDSFFNKFMIRATGITVGALMGALLGTGAVVGVVYLALRYGPSWKCALKLTTNITLEHKAGEEAEAAAVAAAKTATGAAKAAGWTGLMKGTVVAAVAGAGYGGLVGYQASKESKTPLEAAEKTVEDVMKTVEKVKNAMIDVTDKVQGSLKTKSYKETTNE